MLGAGKRLFNADDVGLKALELADTATTPTGVQPADLRARPVLMA
jgi:hypothetical protein